MISLLATLNTLQNDVFEKHSFRINFEGTFFVAIDERFSSFQLGRDTEMYTSRGEKVSSPLFFCSRFTTYSSFFFVLLQAIMKR